MERTNKKLDAAALGRALFEAASEQGILAEVQAEVSSLHHMFLREKGLSDLLASPEGKKARVMFLEETSGAIGPLKAAIHLMDKRNIFGYWPLFVSSFRSFSEPILGITRGLVYSARPLGDDEKERLTAVLSENEGKPLRLTFKVQKSLIGGIRCYYGSTLLDLSVESRLQELETALLGGR